MAFGAASRIFVYVSTSAPSSEGGDVGLEVAMLRDWARSLAHFAGEAPGTDEAKKWLIGPSFTMRPAQAAKTLTKPRSSPPTLSETILVADDNEVSWLASKSFLPNRTEGDPLVKTDASYVDPVIAPEQALN